LRFSQKVPRCSKRIEMSSIRLKLIKTPSAVKISFNSFKPSCWLCNEVFWERHLKVHTYAGVWTIRSNRHGNPGKWVRTIFGGMGSREAVGFVSPSSSPVRHRHVHWRAAFLSIGPIHERHSSYCTLPRAGRTKSSRLKFFLGRYPAFPAIGPTSTRGSTPEPTVPHGVSAVTARARSGQHARCAFGHPTAGGRSIPKMGGRLYCTTVTWDEAKITDVIHSWLTRAFIRAQFYKCVILRTVRGKK